MERLKKKKNSPSGFCYVLTPSEMRCSVAFLNSSRQIMGMNTETDHNCFLQNPLMFTNRNLSLTLLEYN
jgi:hypothetical protein